MLLTIFWPLRNLLSFFLLINFGVQSFAQEADSVKREFWVDLEVRPRAEYRDNFMWTPADSAMPALYVTQRNRATINYINKWFRFHASPQEIHVWGGKNGFSKVGSVNACEFYIEPKLDKNWSFRLGRQALSLDNGRIFSAAPWSQQSRAHEGLRVFYNNKISTDLTIAFTRPYGRAFDPAYSPVASHQYKLLLLHHLKHKFKDWTLTTINAMDVFEKPNLAGQYYRRVTNGGRLEYTSGLLYSTVNAYYQYGRTATLKKIRAYYIQPEISTTFSKTTFRLGAEILSGNSTNIRDDKTHSFVPLYGVAWKFMGNMNLFTRFPSDVSDKGLVNPYLFILRPVNKKLSLRADVHLFYSQFSLARSEDELAGTFLGFESDLSINYKPVKNVEVIYGFSFTLANERMELLKKVPDSGKTPVWSFLMISYAPRIIDLK
ncbi:hypothetical protein DYBT9623_05415 [Dyadobacter sp. CECT 9623]|uniref:Alginate export domain-containing protein n=1 Tax=Dyadobacter linearis TaxID=2823330 RepID=A0ABN7RF24_9BACT|nr:alginate export family protein [Dyadobacter sp. CECT 9623]CAG5074727.1 hypothetical protein DYBT9623_05415 [Dyadobacter sp. CECT 9623]